jgi:hypothetical protein
MNQLLKKITIMIMSLTLLAGTVATVPTYNVYADEDGDVCENPWGDLFVDKENPDLVVDETTSAENQKVTNNISGKLLKTKIKSAKKKTKKAKKAKIVLKKVTKIKNVKYQIKYATNKKFKKARIKAYKSNKITLKNLRSNKTYYVKARAFVKTKNKKVYGKWTKRKRIKVKKRK